ncbi:hypothetical protein Q5O14_09670 [Eubacteriaceae bacterium ES2]|nr:hypothetical protein Q5O14_09670 [Eubacteriaceae bacterium ES2]
MKKRLGWIILLILLAVGIYTNVVFAQSDTEVNAETVGGNTGDISRIMGILPRMEVFCRDPVCWELRERDFD